MLIWLSVVGVRNGFLIVLFDFDRVFVPSIIEPTWTSLPRRRFLAKASIRAIEPLQTLPFSGDWPRSHHAASCSVARYMP